MAVTIKGKIILPADKKDVTFPCGSHLYVSCDDTSRMDAPSIPLGNVVIDVSNKSGNEEICYSLEANLPSSASEISMSATINMGWKRDPNGQEWIRKGDFLNDTTHGIKGEGTQYESDIAVIHYNH